MTNGDDFVGWLVASHPDRDALLADARRLAARLPVGDGLGEITYAFEHDRRAFAVALLATWLRGHVAAIPNDASRHSVGPVLARAENVEFLHDTGVGRGIDVSRFLAESDTRATASATATGDDWTPIRTFASESANPSREWKRSELEAAIEGASRELGDVDGRTALCSLAPTTWPSTLYGLLAPLRAGAPFLASSHEFTDAAQADAEALLVVSPEHSREFESQHERFVVEHDDASWRGDARDLESDALGVAGVLDASVAPDPHRDGSWLVAIATDPEVESAVAGVAEALRHESFELSVSDRLARDASGLVPLAELYLLFGLGRDGARVVHELDFEALDAHEGDDESVARFRVTIPVRYASFEGHFDGHPILAGAVQLDRMVLPTMRRRWPDAGAVRSLSRVKFAHRIDPGETVEVVLRRKAPSKVTFSIDRDGTSCSSGVLNLGDDAS